MSLTSFIGMKDVNDKIKCLRPRGSRKIGVPLRIESRSDRYSMVGTAFDYLLRFEIQRRAPYAAVRDWVAETAANRIFRDDGHVSGGLDLFHGADPKDYLPPEEISKRAKHIVEKAKAAVTAFCKSKSPDNTMRNDLAAYAICLANLDVIVRAGVLDPHFECADPEDVEDLLEMLSIVPFGDLLDKKSIILNPAFGDASLLVGGADADLVSGDLLLDFKVTKKDSMEPKTLDQLLGYFLLWRKERLSNPALQEIGRVGLLFARHGYLWTFDVKEWTEHPEFPEIEQWFFKRADELNSEIAARIAASQKALRRT